MRHGTIQRKKNFFHFDSFFGGFFCVVRWEGRRREERDKLANNILRSFILKFVGRALLICNLTCEFDDERGFFKGEIENR